MAEQNDHNKRSDEALASASASVEDRYDPQNAELNDISQTLNGNKAITGKAVWSTNSAAAMQREDAHQRQQAEEKQETKSREALELAHLAEWNAQKTNLGGVEMTNAEAQAARQHIIDNEDYYAERAVREGRIRRGEEEDYKFHNRRISELEDKKGRRISTNEEDEECRRLKRDRIGQSTGHDVGEIHAQTRDQSMDMNTKTENSNSALRTGVSATPRDGLFQSAPDATAHFGNAVAEETTPQSKPEMAMPISIVRDVKQISFAPE